MSVTVEGLFDVFSQSWERAREQSSTMRDRVAEVEGKVSQEVAYIQKNTLHRNSMSRLGEPHLRTVQFDSEFLPKFEKQADAAQLDESADQLRAHLQGQLTDMLRTFMLDYFPFYQIPDGSDAWERVAETFDNQKLESGIGLVRQRVFGAWAERGITIPSAALGAQLRSVDKAADDALAQSPRAKELIRLRELKGMDMIRFEQVNRQQTEALEAARAFLLSTLLPMSRKVSEDQDRITEYKRNCMDAYYRYLDTLLAADEAELNRLVFERTREVDQQIAEDKRKLIKFQQLVVALESEADTITKRASAALARLGGVIRVSGTENLESE